VHPAATAHGSLHGRARLRPGETALVIGANGALGTCLVQAAASLGAEVVAAVRSPAPVDRLRSLGASRVLVAEPAEALSASTGVAAHGIDVILDSTGQVDVSTVPRHLNPRARIVLLTGRGAATLDLWPFLVNEIQLLGFVMSSMTVLELAAAGAWINAAWDDGRLWVPVGEVLRFADAAEAHTLQETGRLPRTPDGFVGRLVLVP
jgi:NADPH2:quinone reductase